MTCVVGRLRGLSEADCGVDWAPILGRGSHGNSEGACTSDVTVALYGVYSREKPAQGHSQTLQE